MPAACGSQQRYKLGCKCEECRAANATKARTGRQRWPQIGQGRRDRYAIRKAKLDAIKLASGCVDCGYRTHPAALEFDHRDGEVKLWKSISQNLTRAWALVLAEVAKCDVRCANCHHVRSYETDRSRRSERPLE